MSAPVVPDFPDWVPGQSVVAADRLLVDTGAAGVPLPYNSGLLDARPWASAVIQAVAPNTNVGTVAQLVVNHYASGTLIHTDQALFCPYATAGVLDYGIALTVPLVGDQFSVAVPQYDAATPVQFTITGSTRQLRKSVRPLQPSYTGPISLSGSVTLGANSSQNLGIVGPYEHGFHVCPGFAAVGFDMIVRGYFFAGGVTGTYPIGSVLTEAGGYSYGDILAPYTVALIELANNTTSTHTCSYMIQGY